MKIKFGTDGIRGVANEYLTPEMALAIGLGAGQVMLEFGLPPLIALGMDTRQSGPMLAAALSAGFCSAGIGVRNLGVFPTGGISYAVRAGEYGLGAVISASHNPAEDNGIKLFERSGKKITENFEARILDLMASPNSREIGSKVGTIQSVEDPGSDYLKWLESIVPEGLSGMKVAIDAANGAAWQLGIDVFERLGADVVSTGGRPNGMNINAECGATYPHTIQALTEESCADLGVAYDGDADRAVFSDRHGRLVNGDRTMAIWASHWRNHGAFEPPIIVGTVMSNGGFEAYLAKGGMRLERADVGDKYVSAKIEEHKAPIGGEQSGHIIFPKWGPSGDGLVTALELARVLKREARDLASFFDEFTNFPQLLVNVKVAQKDGWAEKQAIQAAIAEAQRKLIGGRLNVRASGTQPILRVMGEHPDSEVCEGAVNHVVNALLGELGGEIYSRTDLTHSLGE